MGAMVAERKLMSATCSSAMRGEKEKKKTRFNTAQVSIVLPVLYPGYLGQ